MASRKGPPKGPPRKKPRKKGAPKLTVVGGGKPKDSPESQPASSPPKPPRECPIVYVPKVDAPPPKKPKPGATKKKPLKGGRKFVCNGPIRRRMIEEAYKGLHRVTIAAVVGVSEQSLTRLVRSCKIAQKKAERTSNLTEWEEELCRFWRSFREAEMFRRVELHMLVVETTDPKVALEMLGRLSPSLYGRRTMVGNAPEDDEDGQPTSKKSAFTSSAPIDPVTAALVQAELRKRSQPDRVLTDADEGAEIGDELFPEPGA